MRRPTQRVYQLSYDEAGKLLSATVTDGKPVADFVVTHSEGTVVYWQRGCPKHACPLRKEECHPDDLAYCRSRGHYQGEP